MLWSSDFAARPFCITVVQGLLDDVLADLRSAAYDQATVDLAALDLYIKGAYGW